MPNPEALNLIRLWAASVEASPAQAEEPLPGRWVQEVTRLDDALVQLSLRREEEAERPVSCNKGCAACCRHLVAVSPLEALHLAALVDRMPSGRRAAVRAAFARNREAMEVSGIAARLRRPGLTPEQRHGAAADYVRLGMDCPFLEEEACSIYAERPFACREHLVTSPPARCADPSGDGVVLVRTPVRMTAAVQAAGRELGIDAPQLPMAWALAAAAELRAASPADPSGAAAFTGAVAREAERQAAAVGPAPEPAGSPLRRLPREMTAALTFATPDGEIRARLGVTRQPVALDEYLPELQQLEEGLIQLAVERQEEWKQPVSCKAGCGACCRQLVPVTAAEALHLSRVVAAMPEARRERVLARFRANQAAVEGGGLGERLRAPSPSPDAVFEAAQEYFRLQLPCPFLEEESCGIHPDRPFACREYLVSSDPSHCAGLSRQGVRKVFVPMDMGSALQKVCVEAGAERQVIPLVWALDWVAEHPEVAEARFDGVQFFTALIHEVDAVCRVLADFTPEAQEGTS